MLKLSKYIHITHDDDISNAHSIVFSTRSAQAIEVPNHVIDQLHQGRFEELAFEVVEELIHSQILVPEYQNELLEVLAFNKASIQDIDSKSLSFTIQPSGNCQLGCHYCGQQHSKKVASGDTIQLIVNRFRKKIQEVKETVERVSITWYGGEPLTGLAELRQISAQAIAIAAENGIKYSADMVTNGLILKPKVFEELVAVHKVLNYQITLDGTAEFHDKRRLLKSGGASFDIIFRNLTEIVTSDFYKASGAKITVRCNVDLQNKENIFELLAMLSEADVLPHINIYSSAVHDWGDVKNTNGIHGIGKEEFAEFEIDFFIALREYGVLKEDRLLPKRQTLACMVTSQTSEVLDAFGNVSTCWEIPYTPAYDNTDFYVGNLHKQEDISSANAPMRKWNDEIPVNHTWCKNCKFLPVCGGGCPKSWYAGTPACPSFKFNINERLFLKKLVKMQGQGALSIPETA